MKDIFKLLGLTLLVYSMGTFPVLRTMNPNQALAGAPPVVTTGGGESATCSDSRGAYRGWSDGRCYNYETKTKNNDQQNTQADTADTNDKGGNQSSMLGMMAIAAGAAMVAAGMAMVPPNIGLIMAGIALIMAGLAALAAAAKMGQNENKAIKNDGRMSAISGAPTPVNGTKLGNGTGASGIKIDPSLTRTGKAGAIFDDFEKKTGISRDELANGLMEGKSVPSILGGSKKMGASESQLQSMLDKASENPPMSGDEVMNKLGLTQEDLNALGNKDDAYASNGAASRSPNSSASNNLDSLFGAPKAPEGGPGYLGSTNPLNLSPDVQAALDRNGITGRSLFQMVNEQYKKKTPMMFGKPAASPSANGTDNPFSNLGGNGGKIDL